MFNKALNISNTFNNENVATLSSVFWLSDMDNTVASVTNMNDVHIASNAHVLMKVGSVSKCLNEDEGCIVV